MMASAAITAGLSWLTLASLVLGSDHLGLAGGFTNFTTAKFRVSLVKEAQVLASLQTSDGSFDFLPSDYLRNRSRNEQYHWGDITYRWRFVGASDHWEQGDSANVRKPVVPLDPLTANLTPTLRTGPLNITRRWSALACGDLGLRFEIHNKDSQAVEIGSLGFPVEVNSIFASRYADEVQDQCSLVDPYIGMDAGHLRVAPVKGSGSALLVTPLGDTPMEAYRFLNEIQDGDIPYQTQEFEGFYEWQVHSKAYADKDWSKAQPWNEPSSRVIQPGESAQYGLRFSIVDGGVRDFDQKLQDLGVPVVASVPGLIIPRGDSSQLLVTSALAIHNISVLPTHALSVKQSGPESYTITPHADALGRARLTITYENGKLQTVHYYITKPGVQAIADLGTFLATKAWYNDTSDVFARAPSIMGWDEEAQAIVLQDPRVWLAGLSDEGGAGNYLAASAKQAVHPNANEIAKLEAFIDETLVKNIQLPDHAVRKSLFYYDPKALPDYQYSSSIVWTDWWSWSKSDAYATDRAYDFVHVAAVYWSLYRAARGYPDLVRRHSANWYLDRAYHTLMRAFSGDVSYTGDGLMGETIFGEILKDLYREGNSTAADAVKSTMLLRLQEWAKESVPFHSEQYWDSTGQEGIYYWSKYFNHTSLQTFTLNSVLGYTPCVPHWGWLGNARRYWDSNYAGKLGLLERQIHHYGSALNGLTLLSAFRSDPSDTYLLRTGYAGINGPMASIQADGHFSSSFHSFPENLFWDAYTGDYGPGFLGMVLGAGTYVAHDAALGMQVYGGAIESSSRGVYHVRTADPVRRRVFIGPLKLGIEIDAGIIQSFSFSGDCSPVTITLGQLAHVPKAKSAVVWVEGGDASWDISGSNIKASRGGWSVPLTSGAVTVMAKRAGSRGTGASWDL